MGAVSLLRVVIANLAATVGDPVRPIVKTCPPTEIAQVVVGRVVIAVESKHSWHNPYERLKDESVFPLLGLVPIRVFEVVVVVAVVVAERTHDRARAKDSHSPVIGDLVGTLKADNRHPAFEVHAVLRTRRADASFMPHGFAGAAAVSFASTYASRDASR